MSDIVEDFEAEAAKCRVSATRARRLATSQTQAEVVAALHDYAAKLDQEAFRFEEQAKELRRTLANNRRLTGEVSDLVAQAREQLEQMLRNLKKR